MSLKIKDIEVDNFLMNEFNFREIQCLILNAIFSLQSFFNFVCHIHTLLQQVAGIYTSRVVTLAK